MITKIELWTPRGYQEKVLNNTGTRTALYTWTSKILTCDLPDKSFKVEDNFFVVDSQEFEVSIQYNPADDDGALFVKMFKCRSQTVDADWIPNATNPEIHNIVAVIYDGTTRVFDGVVKVSGKNYDPSEYVMSFTVADFLAINKVFLDSNYPLGTSPVEFIDPSKLYSVGIENFGRAGENWTTAITTSDIVEREPFKTYELEQCGYTVTAGNEANFVFRSSLADNHFAICIVTKEGDGPMYLYKRWVKYVDIPNPKQSYLIQDDFYMQYSSIGNPYDMTYFENMLSQYSFCDFEIMQNYYGGYIIPRNDTGTIEFYYNGDIWLYGFVLAGDQKVSDVIKAMLVASKTKIIMDKNQIKVMPCAIGPGDETIITPNLSEIAELTYEVIDQVNTAVDESSFACLANNAAYFAATLTPYYDAFLKNVSLDLSFRIKRVVNLGDVINLTGIGGESALNIVCRAYEVQQETEYPDWYSVKAYNIDFEV
jgi:hypothetical protein